MFKDEFSAKKLLREIQILRNLSEMKRNLFTTRLHDIITPEIDKMKKSLVPLHGFGPMSPKTKVSDGIAFKFPTGSSSTKKDKRHFSRN